MHTDKWSSRGSSSGTLAGYVCLSLNGQSNISLYTNASTPARVPYRSIWNSCCWLLQVLELQNSDSPTFHLLAQTVISLAKCLTESFFKLLETFVMRDKENSYNNSRERRYKRIFMRNLKSATFFEDQRNTTIPKIDKKEVSCLAQNQHRSQLLEEAHYLNIL